MSANSFGGRATLKAGGRAYEIFRLDALVQMGGDPKRVNPLLPAELVIDHSVIVDEFGTPRAFQINADLEFQRNRERYALLRWAQKAFSGLKVVPPDTGIVHQVNLEYLARVVFTSDGR